MKKISRIFLFLFFALSIHLFPLKNDPPIVILLSFDGVRWDAISGIAGFDTIRKNGFSVNKMRSVFPSLTFPAHASIATGTFPKRHGIISSSFLEKNGNIRFNEEKSSSWLLAPPIWYYAEKNGYRCAIIRWPLSEGGFRGISPSYSMPYTKDTSDSDAYNFILKLLRKEKEDRPKLIMAWFSGGDHLGHIYGPKSNKYRESIVRSGKIVEELLKEIEKLNLKDNFILMVTSDHGMTEVNQEVDVLSKIPKKGFFPYIALSGPIANIYFDSFRQKEESIKILKRNIKNFLLFKSPLDIPSDISLGESSRVGDTVLVCEIGTIFKPYWDKKNQILKGMHGYNPSHSDMCGIFLSIGKGVPKRTKEDGCLVDIAPTIAKILDLKERDSFDGKPLF